MSSSVQQNGFRSYTRSVNVFKKMEKVRIYKRILFTKIAIGKHLQRTDRSFKYMQYFDKASSFQWINCG